MKKVASGVPKYHTKDITYTVLTVECWKKEEIFKRTLFFFFNFFNAKYLYATVRKLSDRSKPTDRYNINRLFEFSTFRFFVHGPPLVGLVPWSAGRSAWSAALRCAARLYFIFMATCMAFILYGGCAATTAT